MNDADGTMREHRAEIAQRNRRRIADARDRRLMLAMFGIAACQGFWNLLLGAGAVLGGEAAMLDAGIMLALGAMFAFAAYRIWSRDDTRWWVPALPAGLVLILPVVMLFAGYLYLPSPFFMVLDIAMLILIPIRRRTNAAAASLAAPQGPPTARTQSTVDA